MAKKTKLVDITKKRAGPTRRTFIAASGATIAAAASGPLIIVPGKAKAAERVVFATWGGQLPRFGREERLVGAGRHQDRQSFRRCLADV